MVGKWRDLARFSTTTMPWIWTGRACSARGADMRRYFCVVMADLCRVKDHQSHGDHVEVQTLHSHHSPSFLWFKLVFLNPMAWQKMTRQMGVKQLVAEMLQMPLLGSSVFAITSQVNRGRVKLRRNCFGMSERQYTVAVSHVNCSSICVEGTYTIYPYKIPQAFMCKYIIKFAKILKHTAKLHID